MLRTRTKDITITTDLTTEPVDLQDMKDFLKVGYTDEDPLISGMITGARQILEKLLNISFAIKELQVTFSLGPCSEYMLPCGPVKEVVEVQFLYNEADGVQIITNDYKVIGGDFKRFKGKEGYYSIKYKAGYSPCPDALKQGIMKQVAWMYENRGDSSGIGQINPDVLLMLSGYNKSSWI